MTYQYLNLTHQELLNRVSNKAVNNLKKAINQTKNNENMSLLYNEHTINNHGWRTMNESYKANKNQGFRHMILWNTEKNRIDAMLVYDKSKIGNTLHLEYIVARPYARKAGQRLMLYFLIQAKNKNINKVELQNITRRNNYGASSFYNRYKIEQGPNNVYNNSTIILKKPPNNNKNNKNPNKKYLSGTVIKELYTSIVYASNITNTVLNNKMKEFTESLEPPTKRTKTNQ